MRTEKKKTNFVSKTNVKIASKLCTFDEQDSKPEKLENVGRLRSLQ